MLTGLVAVETQDVGDALEYMQNAGEELLWMVKPMLGSVVPSFPEEPKYQITQYANVFDYKLDVSWVSMSKRVMYCVTWYAGQRRFRFELLDGEVFPPRQDVWSYDFDKHISDSGNLEAMLAFARVYRSNVYRHVEQTFA